MTPEDHQKIISKQLSTDNIDYLAELMVANLIKDNIDYNDIDVRAISYFKRGYKKDIERVYFDDEKKTLNFDITRNALYDTLPESLFHDENTYEDIARHKDNKIWLETKRKKYDVEEKQARMLFFPFEKEFFRQRVDIELKEQFYYTNFEKDLPTLRNIVDEIWGINENLTAKQYFSLFRWLPDTYQIVGNISKTEVCLSDILEAEVKIEFKAALVNTLQGYDVPSFICGKESILGVDTVIGDTVDDGTYRWVLHIGPLNKAQVRDFLPDGTKYRLLQIVERIFIPFEVGFETNLLLEKKSSFNDSDGICFELNDNINSVLGFTTVL